MKVLNKNEELKKPDGASFKGYARIGNYSEAPTKNGGSYLNGTLQAVGDVPFKVWGGACFNVMYEKDFSGEIVGIEGTVNEYNGTKSFIITGIYELDEGDLERDGVKESDFFETKYDIDAYWNKLSTKLQKNVSKEAFEVFNLVMSDWVERFKEEFAAVHYHANCKGGLLAHTTKVLQLCSILKMYPNTSGRVSNDVLYVGAALHDVGKIIEYSNGITSKTGNLLSHNILGILILEKHRDEIIELKGEEYYNTMLSIISQHHGDYGDRPRTVAAYIVHQFDLLESNLALLEQTIIDSPTETIKFDSYKLS